MIEHQSIGHTPAGHSKSNGVVAGDGANFTVISSFQSTCDLHHKFDDFSFILLTLFNGFFFLVHIFSISFNLVLVNLSLFVVLFSFVFFCFFCFCYSCDQLCMPNWIQNSGERLVKLETPHKTKL